MGEALPQLWGSGFRGTGQQSVLGPVVPGGPSGAGLPVSSQEGPAVPALVCASLQPVATAVVGTLGQTPWGRQPPLAGSGDSLAGPASLQGQPARASVCAGRTRSPHQGLCLVCPADVLPEELGRGNAPLGHFCRRYPGSSIIFSPPVPGRGSALPASSSRARERPLRSLSHKGLHYLPSL